MSVEGNRPQVGARFDRVRDRAERVLLGLLAFTGVAAIIGGVLLAIRPNGSFLRAKLSALEGTPFTDWRVPGILLATLVGGGGLMAAAWLLTRGWRAREFACLYALGLLGFEIAEWAWIGLQPLEVVFGLVAFAILALALRAEPLGPARRDPAALCSRVEKRLASKPAAGSFSESELEGLPDPARRHVSTAVAPGTALARRRAKEMGADRPRCLGLLLCLGLDDRQQKRQYDGQRERQKMRNPSRGLRSPRQRAPLLGDRPEGRLAASERWQEWWRRPWIVRSR